MADIARVRGASGLASGQVVTTAVPGGSEVLPVRELRRSVWLKNVDGSIVIYVGAGAVTAANGYPLAAGASIELPTTEAISALAASGTPSLAYLETYD